MIEIPKQLQSKKFRFIKVDDNKRPMEKKWSDYNNYKYNDSEFKQFLKEAKGYGVICGFGDLVIVDIENIEDKAVANLVMQHKFLETFTVQTGGGGWHLYYFCPGIKKRIRLQKNGTHYGEIQAQGEQCLGPGSLHPSGNKYTVLNNTEIRTIEKNSLISIVKEFVSENKNPEKFKKINEGVQPLDWDISKLLSYCPGLKTRGGTKYVGPHPIHGSTGGQNFEIDVDKNAWYCFRCEVGGDAVTLVAMLENLIKIHDYCPNKDDFNKVFKQAKKLGIKKYGFPDDGFKPSKKQDNEKLIIYIKVGRSLHLNINGIVGYLRNLHPIISIEDATGRATHIYVYSDGYYKLNGESIVRTNIKRLFENSGAIWTNKAEEEIVKFLKTDNPKHREEINPPSYLINLNNGIYNLKSKKLIPHSPNYYFLYRIPWNYNSKAKKLNKDIENYFNTTFRKNKDYITLTQEIFGYCFYTDYKKYPGLFTLYGTGGNGKSVWISILEAMLGDANISSKSVSSLALSRFTAALLYGKLLNSCGELTSSVLKTTDTVKRLTAGDKIQAEFKGKDGFDFRNTAKIITASNSIPSSYDRTDGWYERQYILPFLEKFRGTEEQDRELIDKLVNKEAMESLVYWSMEGLHRLLKNKQFTYPKNKKERYLMCQGNTEYFLSHYYEKGSFDDYVFVEEVKEAYKKWCDENSIPVDSSQAMANAFKHLGYSDKVERITMDNKQYYIRRYVKGSD